jgi:CDP-diacylglycerol--glycerol-3-phosphate 3-phosphatidyltransferase/cardiolipin synthase
MGFEGTTGTGARQGRTSGPLSAANVVSFARVPLAIAFALTETAGLRAVILAVAAASDLLDGWLARRLGPSRLGAMLDPVTDKIFMITAFVMLALSRELSLPEVAGVLLRDILTPMGYLASVLMRHPFSVPARAGGKAVTVGQSLTLLAWLLESAYLRPLAWATAAMAVYAIWDYGRLMARAGSATP